MTICLMNLNRIIYFLFTSPVNKVVGKIIISPNFSAKTVKLGGNTLDVSGIRTTQKIRYGNEIFCTFSKRLERDRFKIFEILTIQKKIQIQKKNR